MTTHEIYGRFGFHKTPFTPEVRCDEQFRLPLFDRIVEELHTVVDHRLPAALVAPAGTGKTALLRRLISGLPEARYRVRYVKVTGLSKRDFCREIAMACGLPPRGSFPGLMRVVQEHFEADATTDGMRPVLIIDEGHELKPEVLAMLRILTNFDMDSRLVLSLILAGQSPLQGLLMRTDQAAVLNRLAHIDTLRLLSRDELAQYVEHRCAVAGAATTPFDTGALDAIFELSRGNLRATDRLALKALQTASRASEDIVTNAHIVSARKYLWM